MRRWCGVLVLTALVALGGCGSDDDDAATPAATTAPTAPTPDSSAEAPGPVPTGPVPSGTPASGTVELTLVVEDCEGCVITAYQTRGVKDLRTWRSDPVKDGKADLAVPAASTSGMSFDVQGEGLTAGNAVPVVVLASRAGASGPEGNWCWAGTSDRVTTLVIHHERKPVTEGPDDHVDVFRVEPEFPVLADQWMETVEGGLGHQDAPYCNGDSN